MPNRDTLRVLLAVKLAELWLEWARKHNLPLDAPPNALPFHYRNFINSLQIGKDKDDDGRV